MLKITNFLRYTGEKVSRLYCIKKIIVVLLLQILISTLVFAGGIVPPKQDPENPEWVKGEVLIKFKDDVKLQIDNSKGISETGIESLNELNSKWQVSEMEKVFKTEEKRTETKTIVTYTGETREVPQLFNIYKLKIPEEVEVKSVVEDFKDNPNVEYAEPNYIARICVIPDDPSFSNQWGLHNTGQYHLEDADIDAPEAWEIEQGDTSVVIGVIDTGVDYGHPDLADKVIGTGYDFVNNDDGAMDDNGHGSHVAGIAAATTNNALGIAGVAWNCKILPVKVLQSNGYGTYSDVASGVNYAANNNAKVINLSLGGYYESYVLRDALENAYTTAVIIAAAGNDGTTHLPGTPWIAFYPAAWSFVIGVGASDVLYNQQTQTWYEGVASFSNGGLNTDLYAPGVNIYSTIPLFHPHTYSYASWNGTSMAAPFVTGTVALLRSYYSDWSNELIHGQLINTTDPIVGGNRLNAHSALIEVVEPQLSLYSKTIIDTLPGCDQDGIADAGETVEMVFDIQNTWGQAYNVEATINYHSYEDTSFVTIIDSIATFGGGVSPYAHVNNETNPFKFKVKSNTPNNTDVYFDYEITCDGGYSFTGTFYITTQRGIEIGGIIWSDEIWTNDYLYIVTSNTLVDEGVTLTIEPGTRIQFSDYYLRIDGCLIAIGAEDSMIVFTSNAQNPSPGNWQGIKFYDPSEDAVFDANGNYVSGAIINFAEIKFAENGIYIEDASPYIAFNQIHNNKCGCWVEHGSPRIMNNLIRENRNDNGLLLRDDSALVNKNIIESNSGSGGGICCSYAGYHIGSSAVITENIIRGNQMTGSYYGGGGICVLNFSSIKEGPSITHNVISENWSGYNHGGGISLTYVNTNHMCVNNTIMGNKGGIATFLSTQPIAYNNIINNRQNSNQHEIEQWTWGNSCDFTAQHNYWGTYDSNLIDEWIWDYYDDFDLGTVFYQPFANTPITTAPGFLYQVAFNPPPPIGCEIDTFNLTFSKPMDNSIEPYVTFGVCEPYTQHIIEGAWVDSTHWQGTYEFGLTTGDGINYLRVTTAKDCEGMEIPKDTRFSFVVDATGASSIGFIAEAGIGEVELQWHSQEMINLMGYNMYRYHQVTDSTYSDTTLVNTEMITDTTYCDMSVVPNTQYHYMYTGISTDFEESGYSDPASATPFEADPGDANGDMSVDVLDITSIVSYMLNQNPEPFLYDAADINSDQTINVLDIIGVVNIIIGRKKVNLVSRNSSAEIGLTEEGILLKSKGNITALQFDILGKMIDNIKINSELDNFNLSYDIVKDHIKCILYNNEGLTINSGVHKLVNIEGGEDIEINNITAGNEAGNLIKTDINNDLELTPDKFLMHQNYPNPFKHSTTIEYALAKPARVEISIYNIKGQLVKTYKVGEQNAGYYDIVWDSRNESGNRVGNGVYFYKLKADINNANSFERIKKVLIIR